MVDRKGKGKAREVVNGMGQHPGALGEVLDAETSAVLAQRQREMETIHDRHDALVRFSPSLLVEFEAKLK